MPAKTPVRAKPDGLTPVALRVNRPLIAPSRPSSSRLKERCRGVGRSPSKDTKLPSFQTSNPSLRFISFPERCLQKRLAPKGSMLLFYCHALGEPMQWFVQTHNGHRTERRNFRIPVLCACALSHMPAPRRHPGFPRPPTNNDDGHVFSPHAANALADAAEATLSSGCDCQQNAKQGLAHCAAHPCDGFVSMNNSLSLTGGGKSAIVMALLAVCRRLER